MKAVGYPSTSGWSDALNIIPTETFPHRTQEVVQAVVGVSSYLTVAFVADVDITMLDIWTWPPPGHPPGSHTSPPQVGQTHFTFPLAVAFPSTTKLRRSPTTKIAIKAMREGEGRRTSALLLFTF